MERIVWNGLRDILEDLDERQFKNFCRKLCDPHEGYSKIPGSSLENVNRKDVVDLIQRTVSYPQGIELAVTILKDINERDKAENLNGYLNNVIQDEVNFINHHSADLIREVTVVDPILDDLLQQKLLTQEQYHEIHSNPTSEMKMRELYIYVNNWSDRNQPILYRLLKKYNERLITSLHQDKEPRAIQPLRPPHEVNFINHHSEDLIREVTVVDPILDDLLQQKILTQKQYHKICRNPNSQMKMRELYTYVNAWSYRDKTILYGLLKKHNEPLITSLCDQDKEPRPPRELYFINHYSEDLIRQVSVVDPILDDLLQQKLLTLKQYRRIHSNPTSQMKMRELYRYVIDWSDRNQAILYGLLKKHNEQLITSLYHQDKQLRSLPPPLPPPPLTHEVNFINHHSEDLMRKVSVVDPILDDLLQQKLLTQEQYYEIRSNPNSQMKMRKLYMYVNAWSYRDKTILYILLKKYNKKLITSLNRKDKQLRSPPPLPPPPPPHEVRFINHHSQDLIRQVTVVDPILDDLLQQKLLTQEQYHKIRSNPTSEMKMRELYKYVNNWSDRNQVILYGLLKKHNDQLITSLHHQDKQLRSLPPPLPPPPLTQREHFVDRHQPELIQGISLVEPILDSLLAINLLTLQEYDTIWAEVTPQEKMRMLYTYIRHWSNTDKDTLYRIIKKLNIPVITLLEEEDRKRLLKPMMVHFVDRHRQNLIHRVYRLQPVLEKLLKETLLTKEQQDSICSKTTPWEQMEELYHYVGGWGDDDKDKLYDSLRKYNELLIRDLEDQDMGRSPVFSSEKYLDVTQCKAGACLVDSDPQPGSSKDSDLFTDWMFDPQLSDQSSTARTELANIVSSQQRDRLECKLCGKDDDSAFLSMPVINGSVYRLELQSAGLFCCSKTGIKFQVTCPVTIEYELEPWSNYASLIQNLSNGFELLGSLFNIKTDLKPHVVSAVYLPHCLCLKGFKEDTSCIKCAHFKDDNLTLETPTRVEPYYVVLEDPTFSPIGVLLYPFMWIKNRIIQLIPFHGMVLIYWKIYGITDPKHRKFRIHLYLMPCDQLVEMDIDNHEKKLGYDRIHKPHQTAVVYKGRTYDIKASQNARVLPKTLLFQCSYVMELYPYTEITVGDKETNELIVMSVEDGESSVWQAEVDREDINDLVAAISGLSLQEGGQAHVSASGEHFVDKHRPALIDAIPLIEPILDELRSLGLLTDEQCDTVVSRRSSSQDQMRELYRYVTRWGNDDKDKVYQILRRHYKPIICRLERTGN
ncbi:uncharacterized protein ACMZJ9_009936 [Mantella aurantiaca]